MAYLLLTALFDGHAAGSFTCDINLDVATTSFTCRDSPRDAANLRIRPTYKRATHKHHPCACPRSPESQSEKLMKRTIMNHERGYAETPADMPPVGSERSKCLKTAKEPSEKNFASSNWLALIWMVLGVLLAANIVGVARAHQGDEAVTAIMPSISTAIMGSDRVLPTEPRTIPGLKPLTDSLGRTSGTSSTMYSFSLVSHNAPSLERTSISNTASRVSQMSTEASLFSVSAEAASTMILTSAPPSIPQNATMTGATLLNSDINASSLSIATGTVVEAVTESLVTHQTLTVTASASANTTVLNTTTLHLLATVVTTVSFTRPPVTEALSIPPDTTSSPSTMNTSLPQSVTSATPPPPTPSNLPTAPPNMAELTTITSTASTIPTTRPAPPTSAYSMVPMLAPMPFPPLHPSTITLALPSTAINLIPQAADTQPHPVPTPSTSTTTTTITHDNPPAQTNVIPITASESEPATSNLTLHTPALPPLLLKPRSLSITSTSSTSSVASPTSLLLPHHQTAGNAPPRIANSGVRTHSPLGDVLGRVKQSVANTQSVAKGAFWDWVERMGVVDRELGEARMWI